jgi:hypothetical protein
MKAMATNKAPAVETVHRLLFRALLEIRSEGHEHKNKVVFHLADLFHKVVLEMGNAAEGQCTYEDVLKRLEERAAERGLDKWLRTNDAT